MLAKADIIILGLQQFPAHEASKMGSDSQLNILRKLCGEKAFCSLCPPVAKELISMTHAK